MEDIWINLDYLRGMNTRVTLVWCPGHCNIEYNDEADALAKQKRWPKDSLSVKILKPQKPQ